MVSCYFLLAIYSLQWLIQNSGRCHTKEAAACCSTLWSGTVKWLASKVDQKGEEAAVCEDERAEGTEGTEEDRNCFVSSCFAMLQTLESCALGSFAPKCKAWHRNRWNAMISKLMGKTQTNTGWQIGGNVGRIWLYWDDLRCVRDSDWREGRRQLVRSCSNMIKVFRENLWIRRAVTLKSKDIF